MDSDYTETDVFVLYENLLNICSTVFSPAEESSRRSPPRNKQYNKQGSGQMADSNPNLLVHSLYIFYDKGATTSPES